MAAHHLHCPVLQQPQQHLLQLRRCTMRRAARHSISLCELSSAPPAAASCSTPYHCSAKTRPFHCLSIPSSSRSRNSSRNRSRNSRGTATMCATADPSSGCAATAAVVSSVSIDAGQLSLQLLQEEDVQGAGLLLTRAFSGSEGPVKLQEAIRFMQQHAASTADGLTLVARLVPNDPALLPPNKPSRLVGCVSLSFSGASQQDAGSLPPPEGATYLSNMAVDQKFRRQGIARAMLCACDQLAAARCGQQHQQELWLHVRQDDPAALALYAGFGYTEMARDKAGGWIRLGGGARSGRILMRRQLGDG